MRHKAASLIVMLAALASSTFAQAPPKKPVFNFVGLFASVAHTERYNSFTRKGFAGELTAIWSIRDSPWAVHVEAIKGFNRGPVVMRYAVAYRLPIK